MLRKRIDEAVELSHCQLLTPQAATNEQLTLVHAPDYVQQVVDGAFSDVEMRRLGFPWSPLMVERSRRSTGASVAAAQAALVDGISGNLAGGTHHAFADSGQGYCVFNDVCVAARVVKKQNSIRKSLVIDCDVHQGNGTASIAANDTDLFSLSMHCDKNYPFRKTSGDLDVALPEGTTDEVYLCKLKTALDQACETFEPEMVFYLAGADPFEGDRLGHLRISKHGLRLRDEIVFEFCVAKSLPVAFCMAGGYAPNVNDIVDIHYETVCVASRIFQRLKSSKICST